MVKIKKIFMFLLITIFLSICSATNFNIVHADDYIEQYKYNIEFNNGKTVFMMYPYSSNSNEDYFKSGLYYNTDPLENIYLINNKYSNPKYFYKTDLVFTDDGLNFAHLPWTQSQYGSTSGIAIEFYSNGSLIKQYKVNDLITNKTFLKYSVSHVMWEMEQNRVFNVDTNTLTVESLDGTITIFDITSGTIISKNSPIANLTLILIIAAVSIGIVSMVIVLKKRSRKTTL